MFTLLNSPEFVFCYLAAHKIGAVACPVNYRQGAGEIALVIDDSTPKAFIYDAEFGELSGGALDLCENKPAIKIVVGADDAVPAGQVRYADYVADQPENDPPIDFDPHIYDETTRLYTSGTTNRPKGVPINNINEVLSAHDVMMHFPLGSDRPHDEHDPVVPPRRHPLRRPSARPSMRAAKLSFCAILHRSAAWNMPRSTTSRS